MTKCNTPYCRNEATLKRHRCPKCRSRMYKDKHPEAYFFNALRNNARRRGKGFALTLEEFKEFCRRTGYIEKKGKYKTAYSIDRKDSTKGYSIDNIHILTLENNTRRRNGEEVNNVPF